MNRQMIRYTLGKILVVESLLLLVPALVAVIYAEDSLWSFLIVSAAAAVFGLAMVHKKPANTVIYGKEGFAIVTLAWVCVSIVGALPYYISREIPSLIDCIFESISGLTTTGSTILTNIEQLSRSMLFWRNFSLWIGGMGVLIFIMAVIPLAGNNSMHIMRSESTGPMQSKLVPRMKDHTKILYSIYILLTLLLTVFLLAGGMPLFDSIVHALSTAGTGGFSIYTSSIAFYNSVYFEVVITVFMALFGINFNLYFFLVMRNFKGIFKNEEFRAYIGILVTAMLIVALNIMHLYSGFFEALRYSSFQVVSLMTTTGYSTADYTLWPQLSCGILVLIMFFGGSAGSTSGGVKVSRFLIVFKAIKREFRSILHPRSVNVVRLDGKAISDDVVRSTMIHLLLVFIIVGISTVLLSLDVDLVTGFTATVTALNNVGPGLGLVGPNGTFADFSVFSKLVLMFNMLLGRLEIMPFLILFSPRLWRGKAKPKQIK